MSPFRFGQKKGQKLVRGSLFLQIPLKGPFSPKYAQKGGALSSQGALSGRGIIYETTVKKQNILHDFLYRFLI